MALLLELLLLPLAAIERLGGLGHGQIQLLLLLGSSLLLLSQVGAGLLQLAPLCLFLLHMQQLLPQAGHLLNEQRIRGMLGEEALQGFLAPLQCCQLLVQLLPLLLNACPFLLQLRHGCRQLVQSLVFFMEVEIKGAHLRDPFLLPFTSGLALTEMGKGLAMGLLRLALCLVQGRKGLPPLGLSPFQGYDLLLELQ